MFERPLLGFSVLLFSPLQTWEFSADPVAANAKMLQDARTAAIRKLRRGGIKRCECSSGPERPFTRIRLND